jgi:glutamine phosphoribosylpyrophosphate amidotransferase
MAGRPAIIRQRDVRQVIEAARKAGAKDVELRIGTVPVIIHLCTTDQNSIAPEEQIRL